MQPLFQLTIGKPGSSFAFEIARKIGLPEDLLTDASGKAGVKNINYDRHLKDIARDKRYWEAKRQSIRQQEKRLEELMAEYEQELAGAKALRKEIITKAKDEAEELLQQSNRMIENTIRQIKEAQAERERTKDIRQQLEEFKNVVNEEPKPHETKVEKKMALLSSRAGRIKVKRDTLKERTARPVTAEKPLKPGGPGRSTSASTT